MSGYDDQRMLDIWAKFGNKFNINNFFIDEKNDVCIMIDKTKYKFLDLPRKLNVTNNFSDDISDSEWEKCIINIPINSYGDELIIPKCEYIKKNDIWFIKPLEKINRYEFEYFFGIRNDSNSIENKIIKVSSIE